MCLRIATALLGVMVLFSLATRANPVAAAPCHQGVVLADGGQHLDVIDHAAGNEGAPTVPAAPVKDCCEQDSQCDSASCSGGAALPCLDTGFRLPAAAGQPPSAPEQSAIPGCYQPQRPPIFA